MNKKITIGIRSHIDIEDIKNLLCSAGSGGSNYWATTELAYEKEVDSALTEEGINIADEEGDGKIYNLNIKKIKRGLTVMAKKYPKHFADFIADNYDGDTGDIFLQCCIFGEVIYG